MNRKTNAIGIYLLVAGLAVANVFLYLNWKKRTEPIGWEYNDFECAPNHWKYSETNYHSGLATNYVRVSALVKRAADMIGPDKKINERRAYRAIDVLQDIGHDGWELSWTDGISYIVKRRLPKEKWQYDTFLVHFIDQNDEKNP